MDDDVCVCRGVCRGVWGNINCAWHFKQTETIPHTHTHAQWKEVAKAEDAGEEEEEVELNRKKRKGNEASLTNRLDEQNDRQ